MSVRFHCVSFQYNLRSGDVVTSSGDVVFASRDVPSLVDVAVGFFHCRDVATSTDVPAGLSPREMTFWEVWPL